MSDLLMDQFNRTYPYSPSSAWQKECRDLHKGWLRDLDSNPELVDELESIYETMLPLGKQFEQFVLFWFRHSPHIHLIAHGVQLEGESSTAVEIDFLIKDWNGDILLIETALKYFMVTGERKAENCIGPNAKDTLIGKLEKVATKQLNLEFPPLKSYLSANSLKSAKPFLIMKGELFYTNTEKHRFGDSTFFNRAFFSGKRWIFPSKTDWMGPYQKEIGSIPVYESEGAFTRLNEILVETKRSTFLAEVDLSNNKIIELIPKK